MKKAALVLVVFCSLVKGYAQHDAALEKRLATFMALNMAKDLDKVLDYTYPKLFTIVPREQMLAVLKSSFESGEISISFDKMKVDSLYPIFQFNKGSYAKIMYSMTMRMKFKEVMDADTLNNRDEFAEMMLSSLKQQFGEKVTFDKMTKSFVINSRLPMIAVKDEHSPEWIFANFKPDEPIAKQLFSEKLLDKIASY